MLFNCEIAQYAYTSKLHADLARWRTLESRSQQDRARMEASSQRSRLWTLRMLPAPPVNQLNDGSTPRQSAYKVKVRECQRKITTSNKNHTWCCVANLLWLIQTGQGYSMHMVQFMQKITRRRALSHLSLVSCDAGGVDNYPPLSLFVRCTLHHPAQ